MLERLSAFFSKPSEVAGILSASLSNLEMSFQPGRRSVLLFPFVNSVTGFNTGIAVSNVGAGPHGLTVQNGIITFYFFGTLANGKGGLVAVHSSSRAIGAGHVATFNLLYGGPDIGAPPLPGFLGFIYAVCNFPHARGFAFISDPSNVQTAVGYLAEVLPASFKVNTDAAP